MGVSPSSHKAIEVNASITNLLMEKEVDFRQAHQHSEHEPLKPRITCFYYVSFYSEKARKQTDWFRQAPAYLGGGSCFKGDIKAFCCQGLSCIAKTDPDRQETGQQDAIMISANYEMKVNFMLCIHGQKGSELFKFSSA